MVNLRKLNAMKNLNATSLDIKYFFFHRKGIIDKELFFK
jgi:hypothetical protein